jgi:hypothetical protein
VDHLEKDAIGCIVPEKAELILDEFRRLILPYFHNKLKWHMVPERDSYEIVL